MAAPELRLNVSLDLGFFRQQLRQLSAVASSEFNAPLRVKFDRTNLNKEIQTLSRFINNKTFNIKIKTNLEAEIGAADRLVLALQRVQQASGKAQGGLPLGTKGLNRTAGQGGFSAAEIKTLFNASIQGGLLDEKTLGRTRKQMVAALGSIGRDSIKGLLDGLESGDARLQQAAQTLGKNLITSFKDVLGIASPSKEFRKIGDDAGKGFELGLLKAMAMAEQSATRQMQRMLDRLARMALMMGGMSASQISQQVRQMRALPALDWQATTPSRRGANGPSSTGRALPPGALPLGLPGTAFGKQKYLPTALGEELKEVLRNAANAFLDSIRQGIRAVTVTNMGAPPSRQGLLQGGSVAGFLPGRASATNILELNNILAGAIREYFKSVAREIKYRSGSIGKTPLSTTPLLGPSRIAGSLPPAVGRTPSVYSFRTDETQAELFARREREARMRSALRGVDVMQEGGAAGRPASPYSYAYRGARPQGAIVPYGPGGAMVYSGPGGGGGGGGGGDMPPSSGGGGGGRRGSGGGFNVPDLPGTGLIREMGQEFAFATKQVFLFGVAYKALAFMQNFPRQVGQAVAQLQSFRNTLKTVSTSAEEAAASNELILNTASQFNVPLQSMRDGFTKLYASMQPAGFSGDQIRGLFTGISKAAATFGMSADKVDRVNYAFAQMASKGQVMSEELKGQLGDVLPGAMALFAEAAGYKGEKAIQEFSAALEEGRYKGEAMVVLLNNVSLLMNQKFGPGAEGASKTFQGAINNMQNSLKLFYESFEPVAVGFLTGVVTPLSAGIKTLTDGFNAFFTGAATKTSGGFAIAQELEKLRPTFNGLKQNASELIEVFLQFAKVALDVSKILLQIAGNPIVGYLAKLYAIALPINLALNVMRGLWAANALQLILFNARVATGTSTLTAFRGMMAATGATAATTAASIRTAGVTLRAFFAATGVGLVIAGVSLLIERFMSMNQALEDTKNKALGAAQAIRGMSSTQARASEFATSQVIKDLQTLEKSKDLRKLNKSTVTKVPGNMVTRLEAAGVPVTRDLIGQTVIDRSMIPAYIQQQEGLQGEARYRQNQLRFEDKQATTQAIPLATIPPSEGEGKTKTKKLDTYDKSQLGFIEQRLTKEKQSLDQQLQANLLSQTSYDIKLAELTLEMKRAELQERFRLESEKIRAGNFSAADKTLALKEQEVFLQNALVEAENKRNIAVKGAKLELRKPFVDALRNENMEIEKQTTLLSNLKQGFEDLSPEQEANFLIEEKIAQLKADEKRIIQNDIDGLRKQIQLRLENVKLLQQEQKALGLRQQLELAGIVDPRAELRARIRQENPYYSESQVEDEALMKERIERLATATERIRSAAGAMGDAFGEAFKNVVTGSMTAQQAFASFFQSVGDYFADMVAKMISEYLKMQLLNGIMSLLPGLGSFAGGAKIGQSVAMPSSAGIGAGAGILQNSLGQGFGTLGPNFGIRQFANGGMVTGPTLGLVGEGRYNEAIVPLPDGKSIPVELGGAAGNQMNTSIVVNVNNGQAQSNATGSNSSELGRKIEGAVKQVIVGELRPGGLLAR